MERVDLIKSMLDVGTYVIWEKVTSDRSDLPTIEIKVDKVEGMDEYFVVLENGKLIRHEAIRGFVNQSGSYEPYPFYNPTLEFSDEQNKKSTETSSATFEIGTIGG